MSKGHATKSASTHNPTSKEDASSNSEEPNQDPKCSTSFNKLREQHLINPLFRGPRTHAGKKHDSRKQSCRINYLLNPKDACIEDQRRLLIQVILVSWRRESWKPLEAEEEDEEGRSMAPTRLPRCVRRAKLRLRLATSPRVPSSGCISVLLSPSCSKQPPQIFILLQISIPT